MAATVVLDHLRRQGVGRDAVQHDMHVEAVGDRGSMRFKNLRSSMARWRAVFEVPPTTPRPPGTNIYYDCEAGADAYALT